MPNECACREVKPQIIDSTSNFLINSVGLGKKDCLHILHVDDDPCFLEVSKQILMIENNFEIDVATSVNEALKKLEKQTYNAIVSDYEMPLKNGLDFLKELRDQQRDIPFILFTGKGREDVVVKALNLGVDRYINKNGSPETVYCELADAIIKTVERKKSKQLLVASESKYRMLVENSLQGILVTKVAPLRFVFANDAIGKILLFSSRVNVIFPRRNKKLGLRRG
jgi:CheY-like chemotaxis protein